MKIRALIAAVVLAVIPAMSFAASKYVQSDVFEKSVNTFYKKLLEVYGEDEDFQKFQDFNFIGKKAVFRSMYEVTSRYLDTKMKGEDESFRMIRQWQETKSYQKMDFTEYFLVNSSKATLKHLVRYGKSQGYDITALQLNISYYD